MFRWLAQVLLIKQCLTILPHARAHAHANDTYIQILNDILWGTRHYHLRVRVPRYTVSFEFDATKQNNHHQFYYTHINVQMFVTWLTTACDGFVYDGFI